MYLKNDQKLPHQIKKIKEKLVSRINILKTLANKFWKLSDKILIQIYNSLIRSVIDYSLFLYPIMSAKNKAFLQVVQNNCLRIIFRIKYDPNNLISNEFLNQKANISSIEERANKLTYNYLDKAINSENPIISELISEFEEFKVEFKSTKKKYYKTLLGELHI